MHVVPHLVMRSNLELFLERLPVDLEASPVPTPDRAVPRRLDVPGQNARGTLLRKRRTAGSRPRA